MDQFVRANAEFSKFSRTYMERKKNLPIRPSEMGVLNILSETPGPHTAALLAELLGVSKPMITAHLSSLMKKGYITKEPSSDDKRSFHILPTEQALALVASAKEDVNKQLSQFVAHMGQDRFDTLVSLIAEANMILRTEGESQWI